MWITIYSTTFQKKTAELWNNINNSGVIGSSHYVSDSVSNDYSYLPNFKKKQGKTTDAWWRNSKIRQRLRNVL